MTKRKKRALIAISCAAGCLAVACLIGLAVAGSLWGIPPFGGLFDMRIAKLAGNAERYDIENVEELAESPLKGMDILFLGASVTFGAYSQGTAFPEYIAARNGFIEIAASGRMKKNFYTSAKTVQAQLHSFEQAFADITCYLKEIV